MVERHGRVPPPWLPTGPAKAGGVWLAPAPPGAPIRCGVIGATKATAITESENAREARADLAAGDDDYVS
jgi:hypothetical protein